MQTKTLLYAAVGAPVAVAKAAQARVEDIKAKLTEGAGALGKDLEAQLEEWAKEGEDLLGRLGESKALEGRMDLEQVQEQVTKLRDQIEDLLDTWRTNFRPGERNGHAAREGATQAAPVEPTTEQPVETRPASDTRATSSTTRSSSTKPAAEQPTAKQPTAKQPTAKKPAAKKAAPKKPAAPSKPAGSDA